ncbi:hypothetical protein O6H91_13G097700 [Diphasiastrum complanatum]|uniref:Uncharacterized protein n=1 Tax=Diphasiastrum complanatum TaxID=34168 RepID=A0ACC2BY09_DIPCM|nr:hypothetical protein O6H91_13G097700 [Diphasiastrum complanatum]
MAATVLHPLAVEIFIPVAAGVGILFALVQWFIVSRVSVSSSKDGQHPPISNNGYNDYLLQEEGGIDESDAVAKCSEIQAAIAEGAESFLATEYKYLAAFMGIFSIFIFLFLGSVKGFSTKKEPCEYNPSVLCAPALANAFFSTVAFLLGAMTSTLSGYLGMKIATYANARTTLEARNGVGRAFIVAFRSGAVMGFLLAANGLLVLFLAIMVFKLYYGHDWAGLYEAIAGYGLGGSSVALFGRVGGGIYTKAADVGADLVGKVERNIPEDDPRNPAVIADNVGDNVGDIAGMGADLFGSFAESSCAALVVSSISSFGTDLDFVAMNFPLLISGAGIFVCLATTLFATDFSVIKSVKEIEPTLKRQLVISTVLMTVAIGIICYLALPKSFTIYVVGHPPKVVRNWDTCIGMDCVTDKSFLCFVNNLREFRVAVIVGAKNRGGIPEGEQQRENV